MSVPTSFLGRIRRDRRGNTLAIMAAAMIPMVGFAGSAVDMSRMYVVKVRLQQACDAGVLATRKAMTDTSMSTALEASAAAQGQAFFANNFRSGWFQTTSTTFTPTKASINTDSSVANGVAGTATTTVPMAVMSFFKIAPQTLTVTCQAVYDIADSDIMFVLDTTGSMSCLPSDPDDCGGARYSYQRGDGTTAYAATEKTGSKMEALRKAVILFDSTIRSSADPSSHFRYGFVPYASGVNVGRLIPSQYLQQSATYETRQIIGDYNYGSSFTQSLALAKADCPTAQKSVRMPAMGYIRASTGLWTDEGYPQARVYTNITYSKGTCSATAQRVRPRWRYAPATLDVSQFLNSADTGASVTDPTRLEGTPQKWSGCIEELDTTKGASFDVANLPDDLDPDVIPSNANNLWRPLWPDVVWRRDSTASQDLNDDAINEEVGTNGNPTPWYNFTYRYGGYYSGQAMVACGMPAQRLKVMSAQDVRDYVYNVDFKPLGGTYHDTGMIWGTRMLSPDGIFANDTARWPGRKDPQRSIVFMTDGIMAPNRQSYGLWGVENYSNRTGGIANYTVNYNNHVARFRVECDAAKRKGYTIYVVALGTNMTSDLTYCASPGQTYQATSTEELTEAFRNIAQRVAMLRIAQ
jgi:Flp pilus assembly protein TadG